MSAFRYLSVCSGIDAATVAWHPLGWQPVAFSEIEPFPCAVLAHHYPDVTNLGDMTKYESWTISWGPAGTIRILVGGTPCQAFSVAGDRGGLSDDRGNLCLTFCEIADKENPDWIIWENVPGVLSMQDNAFGCFLGRLCGADHPIVPVGAHCNLKKRTTNWNWKSCGIVSGPRRTAAWRILDAQYSGVPQRRRRVFVLAVPGAGNWRCAAALFPVGDGLRWNPPARGEAREGFAAGSLRSTDGGSDVDHARAGHIVSHDPACTLTAREFKGPLPEADLSTVVAHTLRGEGHDAPEDGTGRGVPLVTATPQAVAFTIHGTDGTQSIATETDVHSTLRARTPGMVENSTATVALSFNLRGREGGAMPEVDPDGLACQRAASCGSSRSYVALTGVRRLTPRECARLQGFPDDHCDIIFNGKPAADGPKYRALGNSMAVPVMAWLGRRIEFVTANY